MNKDTTATGIGDWIADRIAEYGSVDAATFDASTRLSDLGFSSVYALTLCGDIEDEFDIEVEPTIVWDHPTIKELAQAVFELLENR